MLDILRSTAKSTIIYSFGNLSSRLAGFILIPLYTSHLSLSEFGVLGMLEISSQVLIALFGLGLYNAFFRWYWDKQYKDRQKSIFFTIIITVISVSILGFIPCMLVKNHLAYLLLDSSQYGNLIVLLFIVSALEAINIVISTLIRIKDKAGMFSLLMVLKLIITLSLNIYFVVYRNKSIEGVYYAQLAGGVAYIILSITFVLKEIEFNFQFKTIKEMLKFSSPLLIVAITGIVLNITDRYSLKFLTDLDEVGKYSLGFKISNTIKVFLITSVNLALQPVIFKMIGEPNNKRFYSKIMTYYSFGLMFFVLGVAVFGEEIVKILSKNTDYWSSYRIIPILSLGMFFTMLRDVALTGINITKKTYITARIITISMVINVLLCAVFVSAFKSTGAAIAATTSQIIFFILVYRYAQKEFFIPYEIKKILIIILIAALLYSISTFSSDLSIGLRLPIKLLIIASFPFALFLGGFYDSIEIDILKQFWKKWRNLSQIINNFKSLKSN